ncbi:hypothetical protein EW145_g3910 [Phellinidium pouzarii]|uniref:Uncharacterized protein n=1 Tax=Phellinidium pouzarii TaxID=167371 RepID=A0A4S4LAN0_9AGAM|nr:hypothetical protein EW145_g3910 [Phellinidium pouzarii]
MSRLKDSLKDSLKDHLLERIHDSGNRRARSHEQSDPQLTGSADSLPSTRLAPLGSGAIVVGTAHEALSLSTGKGLYNATSASAPSHIHQYHKLKPEPVEEEDYVQIFQPGSPALPPLPTSTPTSPIQQPPHVHRDWDVSRRSAESHSSQASGGRGLASVLPDVPRRSDESRNRRRGSPLAQTYKQVPQQVPTQPQVSTQDLSSRLPENELDIPEVQQRTSLEAQLRPQLQRKSGSSISRPRSRLSFTTDSGSRESDSNCFANAPQLPIDLASALPQPPFAPVLLSNLPPDMHKKNRGKIIVILESSTATLKSTFKTLTARPSFLATYLVELVASTRTDAGTFYNAQTPREEVVDAASLYSQRSEFQDSDVDDEIYPGFNSLFQDHLTATGIIKPWRTKRRADITSVIHIFLDRPDAPYEHIMAYLRAPVLSSNPAGLLPYAARLFPASRHSFATARLESLLDLRDEAAYLGLDDLQQLCDNELAGQVPLVATSDGDAAERSSAHSMHTLFEPSSSGAKETSPQVHSVDIPVVLPVHKPRSAPVQTYSSGSTTSNVSRRERRVGQVDMPPTGMVNASQLRQQSHQREQANFFLNSERTLFFSLWSTVYLSSHPEALRARNLIPICTGSTVMKTCEIKLRSDCPEDWHVEALANLASSWATLKELKFDVGIQYSDQDDIPKIHLPELETAAVQLCVDDWIGCKIGDRAERRPINECVQTLLPEHREYNNLRSYEIYTSRLKWNHRGGAVPRYAEDHDNAFNVIINRLPELQHLLIDAENFVPPTSLTAAMPSLHTLVIRNNDKFDAAFVKLARRTSKRTEVGSIDETGTS